MDFFRKENRAAALDACLWDGFFVVKEKTEMSEHSHSGLSDRRPKKDARRPGSM